MSGLMAYLVGPGRTNEHTSPHLVAGDLAMMEWHHEIDSETGQAADVGHDQGLRIARHLDRPRRAFGTTVADGHVFHCSLSLADREGQLSDEKWRQISEAFVDRMGLGDDEGTKAPTRWVAVRHGLSSGGNDHVHLVVNLVREDGTKVSVHQSQTRARDLCRELEREFGLEELESAGKGRASVGFEYGEREASARRRARGEFEQERRAGVETRTWTQLPAGERGALVEAATSQDQPRWELARKVRACATSSVDEGEFVRRLRQHGVLARPRFADTRDARGDQVVVGYSVAAKPAAGERPIWYGGGRLAKDLTLPRLRAEWRYTAPGARAAVAEWTAASRGRRPVAPGREVVTVDPQVWQHVGRELDELRERLRSVPIEDRETWARVARQTSGAFSAWSTRVEGQPGSLAATADALARSAETTRTPAPRRARVPLPSAAGAAYLLLAVSTGNSAAAQLVVMRQLANLAKALHDMHRAEGAARRAATIERAVRSDLVKVAERLAVTVPDRGPAPVPDRDAPGTGVGDGRTRPGQQGSEVTDERALEARRLARQGQAAPGSPAPTRGPGGPARPGPKTPAKTAAERAAETAAEADARRRRRESPRQPGRGPDRGPER